jgi:hypothetical protein
MKKINHSRLLTLFTLFITVIIIIITGLYLRKIGIIKEDFSNKSRPIRMKKSNSIIHLNQSIKPIKSKKIILNNH